MTAAHLGAIGEADRLASLSLMVTVLDQKKASVAAAIYEDEANIAIALSARKGYLDGRELAEVFAWLRPTDLVWRYVVNNYVQGRSPAPFEVLYWNADSTRMPAAPHRGLVRMGVHNALTQPGGVSMLGTPVDLGTVTTDTYVVAGVPTISRRGRPVTAARGCWEVKSSASSGHQVGTSPRWSILRVTRRPPIASVPPMNATPTAGQRLRTSTAIRGGPTSRRGSPSVATVKRRRPKHLADMGFHR